MSSEFLSQAAVRQLLVEPTTLCNAACPMCNRNINGYGKRPDLEINSWGRDDARLVISSLPGLEEIIFSGTNGDPLSAPYFLNHIEQLKLLRPDIRIDICTNGSNRSIGFWKSLLSMLTENDCVTFSVDGLETNYLYRQNTDINKIKERMLLASKAKCMLAWDYLVFKHNEHEIEEAKKISKSS